MTTQAKVSRPNAHNNNSFAAAVHPLSGQKQT
jgi:hypothetical protein